MPKAPAETKIVRQTGMYGTCKTILAMRDGAEIGRAVFDAAVRGRGPVWFIGANGREAELPVETIEVDGYLQILGTNEQMLAAVEAVLAQLAMATDARAA